MKNFLSALGFLTTLPVPALRASGAAASSGESTLSSVDMAPAGAGSPAEHPHPAPLAGTLLYFPVVGALIGTALAGAALAASVAAGPLAAATAALALHVALTGALHWDGLMDTWDGVFVQRAPEERLRIMKEPSVGAFGVMAAVVAALALFSAVASLPSAYLAVSLLLAPLFARAVAILVMRVFPYLPERGLGRLFGRPSFAVTAAVCAAAAASVAALAATPMLAAAAASLVVGLAFCLLCLRRLGTLTGDVYGAVILIVEISFLWGAVVVAKVLS